MLTHELAEACEPFVTVADIQCDCGETPEAEIQAMIDQASDALAILSGGEVRGRCVETFRPRGPSGCWCPCISAWGCTCPPLPGFTVPHPVASDSGGDPDITVSIDGDDFVDWTLVDGKTLIRTDGRPWPGCQHLGLPSGAPGTFEVTVANGELPWLAQQAAAEIVCHFVTANPQSSRRVPGNAKSITAQGVTITLEAIRSEIKFGAFMLPYTVRFMTVYSPDGRHSPQVFSPEIDGGFVLHSLS